MEISLKDKKILVIVESPNKVHTITSILKNAGYKHTTVVASVGHVMELKNGGSYHNTGIDLVIQSGIKNQIILLRQLGQRNNM